MRGYLQRLVARAQLPAAGVRPVVRPLYAAPAEPLGEIAAEELTPTPGRASRATDRMAGAAPGRDAVFARALPLQPVLPSVLADSEKPATRTEVFKPLMQQSEPSTREQAESDAALAPPSGAATHTTSVVHTVQVSRESIFQTLMPPVAAPARAPAAVPAPPALPSVDEIQIHIGRIEVHAVPPAQAPRAVLPRPRHGVNLDEYLKRGRGRTR